MELSFGLAHWQTHQWRWTPFTQNSSKCSKCRLGQIRILWMLCLRTKSHRLSYKMYLHVKKFQSWQYACWRKRNATMSSPNSRKANLIPFSVAEPAACEQKKSVWSRIRYALREPFSEFFGTMILILFGDGVVAQVTLSQDQRGDYQSISWGWGWDISS